jgi:malate dehydrogenase (oxaloacetate-decarboxylating)(NADP+)
MYIQNAFTKEVVDAMVTHNTRPIIFPLSNPVSLSEIDYEDAVNWWFIPLLAAYSQCWSSNVCRTGGNVIFASGSPYTSVSLGEKTFEPGQGNNMYIFPGIGLGALLAKASRVTDSMVEQASIALAGSLDSDERAAGLIYPRLDRIREISPRIALAVVRAAQNAVRPSSKPGYFGQIYWHGYYLVRRLRACAPPRDGQHTFDVYQGTDVESPAN